MVTCARCGEANGPRARFCQACGSALADPPTRPLVRKTVTVVFSDLVGSTGLGEQLDPESLREVVTSYYHRIAAVFDRHGGTVQKFIGDAVLAVFGVPQLHEDDAVRAVRAAAELGEAMVALNAELAGTLGVRLELRTGVNTGDVVVGDVVGGQEIAVGDAVNLAARLEQAAGPGEVLLGEATHGLVRDAVLAEEVGRLAVRGKREQVRAWRLVGVRPGAPGHARRLDTPMVGRDRELLLLTQAFERAVAGPASHLFTVLGAAGVGKSRLVAEFVALVGPQATVLGGRCLDYGDGITYWPVAEILRQAARIGADDPPATGRAKLAELVEGEEHAALVVDRLATLLGWGAEAAPADELSWAVRRLLEALARRRPLIVVLDDLHWAEPTLLELVGHIADWARDAPLLLCCMARPELLDRHAGWGGGKLNATSILLERLSDAEGAELVDHLLDHVQGADAERAKIVEVADGNPLFVEELVAMLVDQGLLIRENGHWAGTPDLDQLRMPMTIAALLGARLDQLEGEERAVIERASVVGKVFYRGAVAELAPAELRPRVDGHLLTLTRKELIRPDGSGFGGEDAFRFRHLLLRDAAYAALSKRDRATLHERMAAWVTRTSGERQAEFEEIIGYHLEQAARCRTELGADEAATGLARRAADHLTAASRRALARGDTSAASKLLTRAVGLLPAADPDRLELLFALGEVLTDENRLDEATQVVAETTRLAETGGERRAGARALLNRASLRMRTSPEGWLEEGGRQVTQALAVLEEAADVHGLVRAWRLLALWHREHGRTGESERACLQVLRYARQAGDRRLEVWGLVDLGFNAFYGATPATAAIDRCQGILEQVAEQPSATAWMLDLLGGLHAMAGRPGETGGFLARAAAIREEVSPELVQAVGSADVGGYAWLWAGQPAAAGQVLQRACEALAQIGERNFYSTLAALLARAVEAGSGPDEEVERHCEASRAAAGNEDVMSQVLWRATMARVLARRGAAEEAERLAREAVVRAERTDFLNLRGDALLDLAEVLRLAGRPAEAAEAGREALRRYQDKGNHASAAQARAVLDGLPAPR